MKCSVFPDFILLLKIIPSSWILDCWIMKYKIRIFINESQLKSCLLLQNPDFSKQASKSLPASESLLSSWLLALFVRLWSLWGFPAIPNQILTGDGITLPDWKCQEVWSHWRAPAKMKQTRLWPGLFHLCGERGIRTPGPARQDNRFRVCPVRPLRHFSDETYYVLNDIFRL